MKRKITKILAALALLVFTMPSLVAWGQDNYVVEFNSTNGDDGTVEITSLEDIVASGANYITSITDASKVYKGKNGFGVKLGSSKVLGTFTMNLSNDGKVDATSIVFNSCKYGSDNSSLKITINGSITETFALTADLTDYTYTFDDATEITSIKIEGVSKRIYVKSMTVNYGGTPTSTCATPTFTPAAGTYTEAQTVSISCTTENSTIYYTTNGDTPTTSSSVYSEPLAISETTTVKAIAAADGFDNSSIATALYTIKCATPTFSPAAGTYTEAQNVTISCATDGATIYYTTDGTNPTTESAVFSSALTISETTTLKAMAAKSGLSNSAVAYAEYTINLPYTGADYVRITDLSGLTDGARVIIAARYNTTATAYYAMTAATTGKPTGVGFTSTSSSNGECLPLDILNSENTYYWTVNVTSDGYTFTNASNKVLGYTSSTNFAEGGNNTVWTIVRNTSGSEAMVANYQGFYITNKNNTGRGIALNNQHNYGPYATSNNNSSDYNFYLDIFVQGYTPAAVATPTFSPAGGTFYESQSVTISCETQDANIYYTTDGTDPTNASTQYTEAITVDETTTIKAIAYVGTDYSAVATATYTIELPLSTMDQIFAAATAAGNNATDARIALNNWVVSGANNSSHAFVTDGTKGFMIYASGSKSNHGFNVGDILSGTVECKVQLYNGAAEITQLTSGTTGLTVTTGGTVTVANIPMADLAGINTGALVSYQNLTCEARVEGNYTNYYLSDGTTEIQAYKTLLNNYADYLEDGKVYNITGVFVLNNTTKRINPRSIEDIVEVPSITIAAYEGDGGYYLIASPVSTTAAAAGMITDNLGASATPETSTYDLYSFDQSEADEWRNYRASNFDIEPAKGYLYASKNGVTLTFQGTPYNGDGTIALTYTEDEGVDFQGLNLVGNPFANETTFTTYDNELGENPELNFLTMNEDGNGFIITTASSFTAAAMQGFFVQATTIAQQLQVEGTGSKTASLNIQVSRNRGNVIDNAIVNFGKASMMNKFYLRDNTTRVYIPQGNREMAVVRSAAEADMPVSFKASENGTYSLSIEAENVNMNYLHLIDNMTGADVDLLQTPSYTFEAKTSDYASRFRLVFKANGTNENNAETFAYFNGSSWTVSNLGEATLQVVDVTGRTVSSETINGNATISLNQTPGVYMLRLVNGNSVKVQKVVVR